MKLNNLERKPSKHRGTLLKAVIHLSAFRSAPLIYLNALWLRVLGRRMRARNIFATLLGNTQGAYDLFVARDDASKTHSIHALPPIIALINTSAEHGSDDTILSLSAEGIPVLAVGTTDVPTLTDAASHIDWNEDPWILPIIAGDRFGKGAATIYRAAIATSNAKVIYSDDDLLDKNSRRILPHFKPDWNRELFKNFDYVSGACILQATESDLQSLSGVEDWITGLTKKVIGISSAHHIRETLHHRRKRPSPLAMPVPFITPRELPSVTIIVPTRNRKDLLKKCLEGLAVTDYPDLEVIVVDNDSDEPDTLAYLEALDPKRYRILRHVGAFNYSAINNRAAALANGRLLCLLNNDIEVIEPMWLANMAIHALREDVGAVGARLLYPNGRIQHAGVVLGVGDAAGHAHRLLLPVETGYFRRHALPQFTSAVTGACLVVARDRFLAVGGLDEHNFPVAFNDVDLCMRLNKRGWQALYEPRATLIHHESVSRGFDRDTVGAARFAGELSALRRLWATDEIVDPFHHPNLSRVTEQFVIALGSI